MRISLTQFSLAGFLLFAGLGSLHADLTWDADLTVNGPQDGGSGNQWNALASNTNWWNDFLGAPIADLAWQNSSQAQAVFGANSGAAGTVLISSATTNMLRFMVFMPPGSGSYNISGVNTTTSKLNFAPNAVITVTNDVSATVSAAMTGSAFTKAGAGTLTLNPASPNVNTGITYVTEGTLVIGAGSANRRVIPGDLIVTNGAVARLGQTGNITNGAVVSIHAGSAFDMSTFSQTLAGVLLNGGAITQSTLGILTVTNFDARSGTISSGPTGSGSLNVSTFTKSTSGTVILGGTTTATATIVSNGTLLVNGTLGPQAASPVSVYSGAVLAGTGTIRQPVTVFSGGTLSPGASLDTLTISNSLTLQAGSSTYVELNQSAGTNDLVRGISTLTYGGSLIVTNLAGALAVSNAFKLFDATNYSGAFDTYILPPLAAGQSWDTSGLTNNGTLKIVGAGPTPLKISSISLTPSGLVVSGSSALGGANYSVLTSTNVLAPLSVWTSVATNQFDVNGDFIFTNAFDPAEPQRFFLIRVP
jgi:autotransporter-associated beta strand protein